MLKIPKYAKELVLLYTISLDFYCTKNKNKTTGALRIPKQALPQSCDSKAHCRSDVAVGRENENREQLMAPEPGLSSSGLMQLRNLLSWCLCAFHLQEMG